MGARIARLLGDHGNIFDNHLAQAAGVGRSTLSRFVSSGQLDRPFQGLYVPGSIELDEATLLRLGLRVGGDRCAIASVTSARLQAGWDRSRDTRLHFIAPTRHNRGARPDMVFHQTAALSDRDVRPVGDLRFLTMTRTCHHLGRVLTPHEIVYIMRSSARLGLLDIEHFAFLVRDHPRAPGNGTARWALHFWEEGSAGTRGASEDLFLAGVRRARFPEPVVNTRGCTGLPDVEPDFAWLRLGKVVEVDGPDHDSPEARARDHEIDERHRAVGIETLRLPSLAVWRELPRALHLVAAFLADGSGGSSLARRSSRSAGVSTS
ncbi:MAG: hypothetical protein JWM98_247 [Thermoleophilia bacterium]|nr:hypothetical protein [Thermoleophilia bacterium]